MDWPSQDQARNRHIGSESTDGNAGCGRVNGIVETTYQTQKTVCGGEVGSSCVLGEGGHVLCVPDDQAHVGATTLQFGHPINR